MENCICSINWSLIAEWATVVITAIGIILGLNQFKSYRKELKNKIFIEFRQRFKSDPINLKVLKYISLNDDDQAALEQDKIPNKYDVYHFLGFYEELHKMLIDKQMSLNDLIYFFGYYYMKLYSLPIFSEAINIDDRLWSRAKSLLKLINDNHVRVLEQMKFD